MILDTMEHSEQYRSSYPAVYQALKAMQAYNAENYPKARVDVDSSKLFLLFKQYTTHAPEGAFMEAHQQYLDVMYMVDGSETIYVKPTARLQHITKPYSDDGDALLAETDADVSAILLQAGDFVVLFPQDAHCPACYGLDGPAQVKKIIAKVRIL